MNKKKKRIPAIGLAFDNNSTAPIEISWINIENNKLILKDSNGKVIETDYITISDTYERKKGHKVVRQAIDRSGSNNLNINALIKKYDYLIVVDTNYKKFDNFSFCVSGSAIVRWKDPERKILETFDQSSLAFLSPLNSKPEMFGWWDIIERFIASDLYNKNHLCALVVDSELGDISDFSLRKKTIYNNKHIPENFEMIYASSDVGKSDGALNKMMSACDTRSKKVLSDLLAADFNFQHSLENFLKLSYYNLNV